MKKIILNSLIAIFVLLISFLTYLSIFGIETKNFNSQIKKKITSLDKNLNIELKTIKLILNPIKLRIEVQSLGSDISYQNRVIQTESIKGLINLKSLLKKNFVFSKLQISTKSIRLKDLVAFSRAIKNKPELFLFERMIKSGYLIADLNLKFDKAGKLNKDIEINGFVKDARIDFFNKYNFEKLNFIFNINDNVFNFKEIDLTFNKLALFSEKIIVLNENNQISIQGIISNKSISIEKKKISKLIRRYFPNIQIEKIKFSSRNNFKFHINKGYQIDNFKLESEIKLDELTYKNNHELKKFLPEINEKINLQNHKVKLGIENNQFQIEGSGKLFLQKEQDNINYIIDGNKNIFNFKTNLELGKNLFEIKFLNYKKKKNLNANLNIEGSYRREKEIFFNKIYIQESENKILFQNIVLDSAYKFLRIDKANLNFLDVDKKKNNLSLSREKSNYSISGTSFNAIPLISNFFKYKKEKKFNFFNENFNLKLKIDNLYIDKEHSVKDLVGVLNIENNKVVNANITSFFDNKDKLVLDIKTKNNEKITNFFSANAKPIVKQYKFIKGFEDGYLDFYSIEKNNSSTSKLKIYDFKLQKLPALTKLLTLASLQGIADILTGEGIRFNEFEMNFKDKDNLMVIDEIYAIGPAISILMEGYVEKNKLVSLRGTLVPATTINKIIGSIPLLGKILVGSKVGEGVFGVSFKIKGHPKKLETTVNPIKTLTPRFITRTLEKIKKN